MSRARNIKPGFFKNDILAECDPLARILFQGLWCEADREGRLENRPKRLKAECLPYDDCDLEALLTQLESRGFILRYVVDGKAYIAVVAFLKHQNPHIKEAESTIPAPCKSGASSEQAGLIPDSLLLIPDSSTPRATRLPADWTLTQEREAYCRKKRPELDPVAVNEGFEDYWRARPGKEALKADWDATWRTWVRNQRAPVGVAVAKPGGGRRNLGAECK